MKINRMQLGEALLAVTLEQFKNVTPEAEIQHTFSPVFQEQIQNISRKSESVIWRIWQAPVKRAILVTILIMIMLVTVACATPAIRNAIIDFFFVEDKTAYGIAFDSNMAANAPGMIENVYLPDLELEGYTLVLEEWDESKVECIWKKEQGEYIHYRQSPIRPNSTADTWIGINAEDTKRTTKNINSYFVEIISNEAKHQYVAVWTDNQYIYRLDISAFSSNQELILQAIMDSLVEVETII